MKCGVSFYETNSTIFRNAIAALDDFKDNDNIFHWNTSKTGYIAILKSSVTECEKRQKKYLHVLETMITHPYTHTVQTNIQV